MQKSFLIVLLLISDFFLFAQKVEIKRPESVWGNKCIAYKREIKGIPKEERYRVDVNNGTIVITAPNKEYFNTIYDKRRDGLAIDVIRSDQYNCEDSVYLRERWPNRGYLLPVLYKPEIKKQSSTNKFGATVIEYGVLPGFFNPDEVECNILVIQKKALCDYINISNIEFGSWELLDVGLYWDTLDTNENVELELLSKNINFEIPFEKDKSLFSDLEIKPLYDSLDLIDFDIKEITITTYTSIEGSKERNEVLQQARAASIIKALQEYQIEKMVSRIITKENWNQFSKDLLGTKYNYLKKYTKEEINNLINNNKVLADSLEFILKNQRKGVVNLSLTKKVSSFENDTTELKMLFNHALDRNSIRQALYLQQLIFEKIRAYEIPETFIDRLEIPESSEFGPLFNNLVLFSSERSSIGLSQTIKEFQKLDSLIPNNDKIKYNLAALKLKTWASITTEEINRTVISRLIKSLESTSIDQSLVKRLWINYNIILSQYLELERDYKQKDRWVKDIYYQYRKAQLTNEESLSLAKYIASYSQFKVAEDILYNKISEDDYSEEILFYYLKLTLGNSKKSSNSKYNLLIKKAVEMNKNRYCSLFLPKSQGGHTFQLKEYPNLKKTFCDFCLE